MKTTASIQMFFAAFTGTKSLRRLVPTAPVAFARVMTILPQLHVTTPKRPVPRGNVLSSANAIGSFKDAELEVSRTQFQQVEHSVELRQTARFGRPAADETAHATPSAGSACGRPKPLDDRAEQAVHADPRRSMTFLLPTTTQARLVHSVLEALRHTALLITSAPLFLGGKAGGRKALPACRRERVRLQASPEICCRRAQTARPADQRGPAVRAHDARTHTFAPRLGWVASVRGSAALTTSEREIEVPASNERLLRPLASAAG